ncbi:hypothetical protein Rhopal_004201-T1 [Rhodotorula paludigena]|uniref:Proteophosphoglycan ppg4 n=1 Tax=Rhodotorula paludigena TaxID=86838 RepID=A0AAV5GLU5_9BASI|nr:hypothetical protein Rhopal_004201-T1 [Rhodotorula paludigena]
MRRLVSARPATPERLGWGSNRVVRDDANGQPATEFPPRQAKAVVHNGPKQVSAPTGSNSQLDTLGHGSPPAPSTTAPPAAQPADQLLPGPAAQTNGDKTNAGTISSISSRPPPMPANQGLLPDPASSSSNLSGALAISESGSSGTVSQAVQFDAWSFPYSAGASADPLELDLLALGFASDSVHGQDAQIDTPPPSLVAPASDLSRPRNGTTEPSIGTDDDDKGTTGKKKRAGPGTSERFKKREKRVDGAKLIDDRDKQRASYRSRVETLKVNFQEIMTRTGGTGILLCAHPAVLGTKASALPHYTRRLTPNLTKADETADLSALPLPPSLFPSSSQLRAVPFSDVTTTVELLFGAMVCVEQEKQVRQTKREHDAMRAQVKSFEAERAALRQAEEDRRAKEIEDAQRQAQDRHQRIDRTIAMLTEMGMSLEDAHARAYALEDGPGAVDS